MRRTAMWLLCAWVLWASPSAAAETWVLWNESSWMLMSAEAPPVITSRANWSITTTFPSRDLCHFAMRLELEGWSAMPKEQTLDGGTLTRSVGVDRASVIVMNKEKKSGIVRTERYLCLPDTVDPREPKR